MLHKGLLEGESEAGSTGIDVLWVQEAPAEWVAEPEPTSLLGHLSDSHQMPLPCLPTPFQADRALHNQPCPALRNPRAFTPPSTAAHLRWLSQTQVLGWHQGGRGRGLGMASTLGATCSLHSLGWARGERRWQGSAEAPPDVLHQAWDAAGAARLPHAGSPCSLISPSQPCSLAAPAFLPGVANGSGWLCTYPGQHPAGARDGPEYPALPSLGG